MELFVIRKFFKETYTIGRFYNENMFICSTLEDRIRDLQDRNHDGDFDDEGEGKLYGMTAIPCGRYEVIVNHSQKLKRRLPLLLNVEGFTGIRIHAGKNERHTEGCILVGDNKTKGSLENGPYWESFIRDMIEEALKTEKVYLTVKE
jgi:hypothetical protein